MQKTFDCGIDLGTTNSCLAIPGESTSFEIVENQQDRMKVTPSAVEINARGRITVGQRAYNSQHPENLAIQFKRQMGTKRVFHFEAANIDKSPEELSSEILKRIRADAESRLMHPVENVVITVPAAFKALQTEATNRAGQMAGFKNIILLQEPIAAAIAYGAKPDTTDKCWMVFDYGGGTLDVAIVTTEADRLEVISSAGDNYFGGSDIDRKLFENVILPKIEESGYKVAELFNERTESGRSVVRSILLRCENAKIQLSSSEDVLFELFDITDDDGNDIEFECTIHRNELEALISEKVEESIQIAKTAWESALKRKPSLKLDKILLVGGSTFIPLVRNSLKNEFNVELDCSLDPMSVVAAGAAVYASTSVIDVEDIVPTDNNGKAILSLTYDPISPTEHVDIIGKVVNVDQVKPSRVRIDCAKSSDFSGAIWTSGWMEMLDEDSGVFDVEVLLQKNQLNHFRVFLSDSFGSVIEADNTDFDIRHTEASKIVGAPTATNSIGVKVWQSESGSDELDILVKKDAPLPAKAVRTYKTNKELYPEEDDEISIEIFEGENITNPDANHPAGTIFLKSTAMKYRVPKGTEVELTVEQDVNRNIHVSGFIPDFDYVIPEETLRPVAEENLYERLSTVEDRMETLSETLDAMDGNDENVQELKDQLEEMEEQFTEMQDRLESDDGTVSHYIDDFYDLETKAKDIQKQHTEDSTDTLASAEFSRQIVMEHGSDEDKRRMSQLSKELSSASTRSEKEFIAGQMNDLRSEMSWNNFNWLANTYVDTFHQEGKVTYKNPAKVSYWKQEAEKAIRNHSVPELRNAILQLCELADFGPSGESPMAIMADLMK